MMFIMSMDIDIDMESQPLMEELVESHHGLDGSLMSGSIFRELVCKYDEKRFEQIPDSALNAYGKLDKTLQMISSHEKRISALESVNPRLFTLVCLLLLCYVVGGLITCLIAYTITMIYE